MHNRTDLAAGPINGSDRLTVQLIQPADTPPIVAVNWPSKPTVATPANYPVVAAAITQLIAEPLPRWHGGRRAGCNRA